MIPTGCGPPRLDCIDDQTRCGWADLVAAHPRHIPVSRCGARATTRVAPIGASLRSRPQVNLSPQAAIVCTQVDREGRHPDLSPSFQDEPSVGASRLKAQARNPSGSKRDEGWVPGSRFQRAGARRTRAPERQQRGCVNRIAASGERYLRAPTTHTGPAASPRSLDRHRRPRRAC